MTFRNLNLKAWMPYALSGLLGIALAAPIPSGVPTETILKAWYPGAYQWFALAAGFFCALVYPKRFWIYPICISSAPAIVFGSRQDPSGTMAWLLFFGAIFSGIGGFVGWVIRWALTKLDLPLESSTDLENPPR